MSDEFNPPHAPRAASRPDAPRPAAQADHPLRLGAIVIVLAGIVVLQFVVAVASMGVLSALRAYVAGESLYSKGQKDALLYLHEYVESHVEDDYRNFRRALTVPLGDRIAREALQADAGPGRGARGFPRRRQSSRGHRRPDLGLRSVPLGPVHGRRHRDLDRRRHRHRGDAQPGRARARANCGGRCPGAGRA